MLIVVDRVGDLSFGTLEAALNGCLVLGAAAAQTALQLGHVRGQDKNRGGTGYIFLMLPAPSTSMTRMTGIPSFMRPSISLRNVP